ncbi:hypothetical protein HYFRA_00001097 [Hymenoscyphus fraxineus]|uniref:Uncharacterized protein n=1 Tax=Hymenoscyphus fraxineus TaxID=746836 RepID=A0A9N9KUF8_9HELO|nr:hypothetical protein HYFRA_00001097 [Hymenoscyphus fraxineus]
MDVVAGWFVDAEFDNAEKFRDILRNAIVLVGDESWQIGVSVDSPPAGLCFVLTQHYHMTIFAGTPSGALLSSAINESTACFSSSEEGEEEIRENSLRYTGTQQAVEHGPIIEFDCPAQEPEVDLIPLHLGIWSPIDQ